MQLQGRHFLLGAAYYICLLCFQELLMFHIFLICQVAKPNQPDNDAGIELRLKIENRIGHSNMILKRCNFSLLTYLIVMQSLVIKEKPPIKTPKIVFNSNRNKPSKALLMLSNVYYNFTISILFLILEFKSIKNAEHIIFFDRFGLTDNWWL